MKTRLVGYSAKNWLLSQGLLAPKADEVLASFSKDCLPTIYSYSAPHTFLRFHGSSAKTNIFDPNYWVDISALGSAFDRASQFENYLSEEEISKVAKTYYRNITAICHNWNPLKSDALWKIELRGSETVVGLEGPIAPQPTQAATKSEAASSSMLEGGAIQVFLNPKTPFICTPINWENL